MPINKITDQKRKGNRILENNHNPTCDYCSAGEKRIELSFSDPLRQLGGELILRKIEIECLNNSGLPNDHETEAEHILPRSPFKKWKIPKKDIKLIATSALKEIKKSN